MKKITSTASYSLIQGTMWAFYAILLGYSSNFLYACGFTDGRISLVLGAATAVSCVLQLGLAELISRIRRLTVFKVLIVLSILMIAGSAAMLWDNFGVISVAGLAICCALLQAIPAMGNAIGIQALDRGSTMNYGISRGIGSASYSLMALLTGQIVSSFGEHTIAVIAVINSVLFLLGVIWFHFAGEMPGDTEPTEKTVKKAGFLKSYPLFALFLLGCILLFISHNLVCNFMLQIITIKGGGSAEQGVATFIAALTEIPIMFCFALLMKKVRCEKWMMLSSIFFIIKAMGLFLAKDTTGVYLAQTTQVLGYAIYSIGSIHYTRLAVGKDDTVRAQSYFSSTTAIGGLFAMYTGGFLCEWFTPQGMLLCAAAVAAIGAVIVIITARMQMKKQSAVI